MTGKKHFCHYENKMQHPRIINIPKLKLHRGAAMRECAGEIIQAQYA